MPDRDVNLNLPLIEQPERKRKAKLDWLRAATKEAFDSIDRGEGLEFETMDDLAVYVHQLGQEVCEIDAHRKRH
jgi:hypothetical protein